MDCPSAFKGRKQGVTLRAATLTAESRTETKLGWEWLQAGHLWPRQGGEGALGSGATQRWSCQALLVATLESGEGQKSWPWECCGPAQHSEEATLWAQWGPAILKPKLGGRKLLTSVYPKASSATQGSSNWHSNNWQLAA